ncbi:MAG: ArsA family ATPase, partial [Gemmatimonadota bacterium]|nr:ArsA family ATPase [Gemmatimonadota bacterium]
MTLLTDLIARRVLFFGGKGGVGKSTMATAAALHSAEQGFKTLLVSTDPAHSTSDVLNIDPASVPTAVVDKLDLLEIDPAREVDDYIETVRGNIKKSTPPRLIDEVNRQLDGARLSPGAEESALFDRITRILEAKTSAYDRLIFDTAP